MIETNIVRWASGFGKSGSDTNSERSYAGSQILSTGSEAGRCLSGMSSRGLRFHSWVIRVLSALKPDRGVLWL